MKPGEARLASMEILERKKTKNASLVDFGQREVKLSSIKSTGHFYELVYQHIVLCSFDWDWNGMDAEYTRDFEGSLGYT